MKSMLLTCLILALQISANAQELCVFQSKDSLPMTAEQSVAVAVSRSILEADWEKLDALLDEDFTYSGDGFLFTKDEYIGFMQEMRSAFSNFSMTLEKSVANGRFVSIRFVANAVNTGKFMGAPATENQLEVNGIFIREVYDGRVMQEWQTTDLLGVMKQIGGGSLFFYSMFVGGFNVQSPRPVRMPNDFLHLEGLVSNFDRLSAKQKKKYIKKYKNNLERNSKKNT